MIITFTSSIGLNWSLENMKSNLTVKTGSDKILSQKIVLDDGDYRLKLSNTQLIDLDNLYSMTIDDIIKIDQFPKDGTFAIINIKNGLATDKIFSTKKAVQIQADVNINKEMNVNSNYDINVENSGAIILDNNSSINLNHDSSRLIIKDNGQFICDSDATVNVNKRNFILAENNIRENYKCSHGIVFNNSELDCENLNINIEQNGQVSIDGYVNATNSNININANTKTTSLIIVENGTLETKSLCIKM